MRKEDVDGIMGGEILNFITTNATKSGGTPLDRTNVGNAKAQSERPYVAEAEGFLAEMNVTDRCSPQWLRFDAVMNEDRIHVFVDSGASHCYLAKRIVDRLGLELEHSSGSI